MKLDELSQWDKDTLRFEARGLLDDKRSPIVDFPDWKQRHALRVRLGIVIGPEKEVLRIVGSSEQYGAKLRECNHGIPCHHYCGGVAEGRCTERPFFPCGVPTGECVQLNGNLLPEAEKQWMLRICQECREKEKVGLQTPSSGV